jgi:hypothetical protein
MHILGLCNGAIRGNSEILLKAALKAAVASDPTITVSWIHVPSIALPRNPKPSSPIQGSSLAGMTMLLDRPEVVSRTTDGQLSTPSWTRMP